MLGFHSIDDAVKGTQFMYQEGKQMKFCSGEYTGLFEHLLITFVAQMEQCRTCLVTLKARITRILTSMCVYMLKSVSMQTIACDLYPRNEQNIIIPEDVAIYVHMRS